MALIVGCFWGLGSFSRREFRSVVWSLVGHGRRGAFPSLGAAFRLDRYLIR